MFMIDTGMTRCGCGMDDLPALLSRIESHSSLRIAALGTHFRNFRRTGASVRHEQLTRFHNATDGFAATRAGKVIRTVANSGGIFFAPGSHFDMVGRGFRCTESTPPANRT